MPGKSVKNWRNTKRCGKGMSKTKAAKITNASVRKRKQKLARRRKR